MSLCVCLRVRPWEEMTVGGTQGVPASSRERPERSWGLAGALEVKAAGVCVSHGELATGGFTAFRHSNPATFSLPE